MRKALFICFLVLTVAGCSTSDSDRASSKSPSDHSGPESTPPVVVANESPSPETTAAEPEPKFEFDNVTFDSPTIIAFGGNKNFNHTLYPSPAIFDVDDDGADELVLGDLFGSLKSCENENKGKGDPVWSTPVSLKTEDEEPIDMENW